MAYRWRVLLVLLSLLSGNAVSGQLRLVLALPLGTPEEHRLLRKGVDQALSDLAGELPEPVQVEVLSAAPDELAPALETAAVAGLDGLFLWTDDAAQLAPVLRLLALARVPVVNLFHALPGAFVLREEHPGRPLDNLTVAALEQVSRGERPSLTVLHLQAAGYQATEYLLSHRLGWETAAAPPPIPVLLITPANIRFWREP